MDRNYIIHTKKGCLILSRDEIIRNAEQQEKDGIKPQYYYYDYKRREKVTPPGWLVWSTWEDGAGVCYRREDGSYGIATGWQGDFICA